MDTFSDIIFLAQKAAQAPDTKAQLKAAKQLEMLVRSAIVELSFRLKRET